MVIKLYDSYLINHFLISIQQIDDMYKFFIKLHVLLSEQDYLKIQNFCPNHRRYYEYNCLFMIENILGSCQTRSISFLYFVVQEKVTLQLQLVAEVFEVVSQLPNSSDHRL